MDSPQNDEVKIDYSCVARGSTILCSHQVGTGSLETEAKSILCAGSCDEDKKITFTKERHMFHCLFDNGFVYMCNTGEDFSRHYAYAYLTEIKTSFQNCSFAMTAFDAREHEYDSIYSATLANLMEKYSKTDGNSSVSLLKSQVEEVKGIMVQNIQKFTEREDNLVILIEKTEELMPAASAFKKVTTKIRQKFWWKNVKLLIIMAIVIIILLTVGILLICYGEGVFDDDSTKAYAQSTVMVRTTRIPVKTTELMERL